MASQFIRVFCPVCGEIDAIRKVSAIYGSGTQSSELFGHYSGPTFGKSIGWTSGTIRMKGVTQTYLSKRLAPPKKPEFNYCPLILCVVGRFLPIIGYFIFYPALIWLIVSTIWWRVNSNKLIMQWQQQFSTWNK